MANIKISELDELVEVANDDYLPIVDTSAGETKKVKNSNLVADKLDKSNVKTITTNTDNDVYSCNYINNIIETGTNDKGRYEKYANGMLKCYYIQTISTDIKNSWGGLVISPIIQLQDYPITFKAITSLNMSVVGVNASAWIINGGDFNLYRPCPINLCTANPLNLPNDFRISVCAIGTWK